MVINLKPYYELLEPRVMQCRLVNENFSARLIRWNKIGNINRTFQLLNQRHFIVTICRCPDFVQVSFYLNFESEVFYEN